MRKGWWFLLAAIVIVAAFIWWLIEANRVDEFRKETTPIGSGITWTEEHEDVPVAVFLATIGSEQW